jgi:molybdopterin converting factor small subunit
VKVRVRIPSPLRQLTAGAAQVEVEGSTVGEALHNLEQQYPGFEPRLFEASGGLRHFVNVYRNDEDIRGAGGLDATLSGDDELSIVPAVAGGGPGRALG